MIEVVVVQVVLTVFLVLTVRRFISGSQAGLQRHLEEARAALAAAHEGERKRLAALQQLLENIQAEGARSQAARERAVLDIGNKLQEVHGGIDGISAAMNSISGRLLATAEAAALFANLQERVERNSRSLTRLSISVSDLRSQCSRLGAMREAGTTTGPEESFPIDQELLRQRPPEEMLRLAEAVATVRPLVPYPNWHFDSEWSNRDMAFQLRQSIWQYFNDHPVETPVVIDWHHGTRLALQMGDDVSRQIYIAGCIDPNEFAFLDRFLQPGMTFFDVGANDGIYSIFAASRVGNGGTVWAFEPSTREAARLRRNVELNGFAVRIFGAALADRQETSELRVAEPEHAGQNTLGAFIYDVALARTEQIDLIRLDDVVSKNPPSRIDLIKVDIEGAELRMFRGALETLRRYKPVLLLEVSDDSLRKQGASREELLEFLGKEEYGLVGFDPYSGVPSTSPALSGVNVLAVPRGVSLPPAVYRVWPEGDH